MTEIVVVRGIYETEKTGIETFDVGMIREIDFAIETRSMIEIDFEIDREIGAELVVGREVEVVVGIQGQCLSFPTCLIVKCCIGFVDIFFIIGLAEMVTPKIYSRIAFQRD